MASFVAKVVISDTNSELLGVVVTNYWFAAENYDDAVKFADDKFKTEYLDVFVS